MTLPTANAETDKDKAATEAARIILSLFIFMTIPFDLLSFLGDTKSRYYYLKGSQNYKCKFNR